MIKAVIFDLDGTLVNTLEDLANATNFALAKNGFETHSLEKYRYFVGNGMQLLVERALPEGSKTPENIQKAYQSFLEYYGKHFKDKTVVYDGIFELLSHLKSKGIKTAVVTNKNHNMAKAVTDEILSGGFACVLGRSEDFPAKPDPSTTHLALQNMGVRAEECLFVGDSYVDMKTAANAGVKSVGVTWGFRKREELLENGADYIIDNPKELYDLV